MRKRVVIFLAVVVSIGLGFAVKTSSVNQDQGTRTATLEGLAEQAKAAGKSEISFPTTVINEYGVTRDVNEALESFNVVVASVVYKKSFVDESDQIRTWYKFKIVENLHKSNKKCDSCQSSLNPPADMEPAGEDEFLLLKDGGTVVIKGVKVTSYDPAFPDLSPSARYMFFISPNSNERNAAVSMGPFGIYEIDDKDDIEPIRKDHPLGKDFKARFGNSMAKVKANLKLKDAPQ